MRLGGQSAIITAGRSITSSGFSSTLNQFNIPEAGLLLILGVDTFLDMGRSATNAVGNSIASAVVAKWEGELLPEAEADALARKLDAEAAQAAHPLPTPDVAA